MFFDSKENTKMSKSMHFILHIELNIMNSFQIKINIFMLIFHADLLIFLYYDDVAWLTCSLIDNLKYVIYLT